MILRIRNSRIGKTFSVFMIFIFLVTLNPLGSSALTGGPAQPEFNSFTPIGTSDMVDLSSGDFSYNIPLMDVGGFPINLAYSSGVTMDQEASWVGLGWDLSIGQINRQMRGLPDDFDGDTVVYENNMKDNWTVGGTFQFSPELFDFDPDKNKSPKDSSGFLKMNVGISGQYNSYNGYSFSPSFGMSYKMAEGNKVGFNAESTPDGLVLSPSYSLANQTKTKYEEDVTLTRTFGVSFNSRQGLSNFNLSTSASGTEMYKAAGEDKKRNYSGGLSGSSISFVNNTFTPTVQTNMTTISGTFNTAYGATVFGAEGEAEVTGFASNQFIANKRDERVVYGYENTEKAPTEAVLDFNREKDGVFSVNSTNLPLTNYTYDIYNVQGQGVSGMFHPFRSQVGYVYDNKTVSNSSGLSAGLEGEGGGLFGVGVELEGNYARNKSGVWKNLNQALSEGSFEEEANNDPDYEEVYFKNVGDLSVDHEDHIYGYDPADGTRLGGYDPVRLKFGAVPYARTLKNNYMRKGETFYLYDESEPFTDDMTAGWDIVKEDILRTERVKRNQTILRVSEEEAEHIGYGFEPNDNAKSHHTVGFIVTRNDGARYNYGKALYNTTKKEVTFAVGDEVGQAIFGEYGTMGNTSTGLVAYDPGVDNSLDNGKGDHYFNRITTPAYGHTFLLTSLVSTDYADVDDIEGPSVGDFGSYTSFEYRNTGTYKWRVPFQQNQANFNEGLKTDPTDDKGSYVYGEKETSYIQKIETKTHVALFYISERKDGYGVAGEDGGIGLESEMYRLDKIMLFSRGEFYEKNEAGDEIIVDEGTDGDGNITTSATPIKTVHFEYEYSLCPGVLNNIDNYSGGVLKDEALRSGGKLTLTKVYFTYRNSNMGKYSAYEFRYGDEDHDWDELDTDAVDDTDGRNPKYNLKGYDIWGCYKENADGVMGDYLNPLSEITAPEFNYVEQTTAAEKATSDDYAAAWSLSDIALPSGGEIQVDYESDDYQYVQNKKAMRMFKIAGAGATSDPVADGTFDFESWVDADDDGVIDQANGEALLFKGPNRADYLYFLLDEEDQVDELGETPLSNDIFRKKYMQDIYDNQDGLLQFRMFLNMTPDGGKKTGSGWKDEAFDYVSGYAELDNIDQCTFFVGGDGKRYGSIKLRSVDMEGGWVGIADVQAQPIAKAGWQFARRYLGKYVYGMPALEDGTPAGAALEGVYQAFENLAETFAGGNGVLKAKNIARRFIKDKSWIRLSEPTQYKKGGGCRVKRITMTDEWADMLGDTDPESILNQKYGQEYTYELENGGSSGVATYEPVGSKENPLVQPVFVNTNRLLAPDDQNYMEKPFGESFFPSPTVTYSRVSVKNLERVKNEGTVDEERVTKHATGEVVTEFFTSKDYPTIVDQTYLRIEEDANPLLAAIFSLNVMKHITLSQGYSVHLNDMNGKMKSQRIYAEGQDGAISGVDYKYDLNGPETPSLQFGNQGKLNNTVLTMDPNGDVKPRKIGVEQNIINDFREMKSTTQVAGVDLSTQTFAIGPLVLAVPAWFPKYSRHVDKLNMATTTKVVNTYGVLRETVAYDAGASVHTRNLVWDSHTGDVLITETVNEYDDRYYSFNFPAHWNYDGMGQAAFNSGLILSYTSNFVEGGVGSYEYTGPGELNDYLRNGDEVLVKTGIPENPYDIVWVTDIDNVASTFFLMKKDGDGIVVPGSGVSADLRVIRSGRRNLQTTSMGSIVFQGDPLELFTSVGPNEYTFNPSQFTVSPSAALGASDHWKTVRIVNSGAVEFKDEWDLQCECGFDPLNEEYNPYLYNMKGVWRANKSHLYLTGRHHNDGNPDPRNDGFYKSFESFYVLDGAGNWSIVEGDWTFTSEVTQFSPYGFELENADALDRYSAAQYGYNFSFPLAVGANSEYGEIGYDGFEDYSFDGCEENEHFGFRGELNDDVIIVNGKSHTGRHSLRVPAGGAVENIYRIDCGDE